MRRRKDLGTIEPASGAAHVGYARPSTDDPDLSAQLAALDRAGCSTVYQEQATERGKNAELDEAIDALRAGDTLIVWRLEHIGRTLSELVAMLHELIARGVHFQSLTEKIDTAGEQGKAFAQVIVALFEYERRRRSEQTRAGLAVARARGRKGGRPKALTPAQIRKIRKLSENPNTLVKDLCEQFGISRATYYKHVGSVIPDRTGAN